MNLLSLWFVRKIANAHSYLLQNTHCIQIANVDPLTLLSAKLAEHCLHECVYVTTEQLESPANREKASVCWKLTHRIAGTSRISHSTER